MFDQLTRSLNSPRNKCKLLHIDTSKMNQATPWRGSTKLSKDKARRIRERFASGEAVAVLAAEFGVSDQAIKDIINFETWASAGGPRSAPGRNHS